MDRCRSCGGTLEDCNESVIVCPFCGESDCWPRFDHLIDANLDDLEFDLVLGTDVDSEAEDTG